MLSACSIGSYRHRMFQTNTQASRAKASSDINTPLETLATVVLGSAGCWFASETLAGRFWRAGKSSWDPSFDASCGALKTSGGFGGSLSGLANRLAGALYNFQYKELYATLIVT